MTTPDQNFDALGLQLPPAPAPKGVYKPCLIVGNFIYVSGHGPYMPGRGTADDSLMTGRIGEDVDMAFGKEAAQQTGLAILSTLKAKLGSLNHVKQVVKILGMVNCVPDFEEHPKVINGCSELFAKIWGDEHGIGVRSAVGMGSLPGNISVEIEAMFELDE
jgi:enamine deaminase RidA (YjgF/YER057c/UK114 family)